MTDKAESRWATTLWSWLRGIFAALFAPTPLKAGLLVTVVTVSFHTYLTPYVPWSSLTVSQLVERVDDQVRDFMFNLRGPEIRDDYHAVVLDIDEKSLAELGQWPWSRDVFAEILQKISTGKPKAIGLDIVFAEPDRTSLKRYIPRLASLAGKKVEFSDDIDFIEPKEALEALRTVLDFKGDFTDKTGKSLDNDAVLADVVRSTPNLILGYFFQLDNDKLKEDWMIPWGAGTFVVKRQPGAIDHSPFKAKGFVPYRPVLNWPLLDEAAEERAGAFNAALKQAGKVRRVPLIWEYEDNIYPTLSLQMLRIGEVGSRSTGLVWMGGGGVEKITIGDKLYIPTDSVGQLYVNYRGKGRTFPYISAVDLLKGRVDPSVLEGKYVLVGASAGGILDLRATPYDDACPGVEVHANVIDNILEGDMLQEPFWAFGAELSIMFFGGILLTLVLVYTRPVFGALFALAIICGMGWYSYYMMFDEHVIISLAFPLTTLFLVFMSVTMFNYFFEGRQKRFIQGAFSSYLSTELVEQLVDEPEKLSLKGEQKELTVLFSDIRGFTSISEKLTAEELAAFLNEYLTPMADIVITARGYVDKFIGDAVMAFWGAPVDDLAHARNASRASLEMIATLNRLQPEWDQRGLPRIDIGIGLNSGLMSVGNMGSQNRFNYTVMGDNVNLGARLEGLNKTYGTNIIISNSTRQILGSDFLCRHLDKVRVKGKIEPVEIFELVGEEPVAASMRAEVDDFESAYVDYHAQKWDDAERKLKSLQGQDDRLLYRLYLERIAEFRQQPPESDWDGVFTFTHK